MNETAKNLTNTVPVEGSVKPFFVYIAVVVFLTLFFTGLCLDVFVIYVMVRSGQLRKNISSFLLFHLSFTHLLFHVVFAVTIRDGPLQRKSAALCKVSAFIEHVCPAAIFSTLAAIAWDRHKNVLQPFKSLVAQTLKSYLLLVAAIWTYAVISSVSFVNSVNDRIYKVCSTENNTQQQTCEEYHTCVTPIDWKIQISETVYFLMAFFIPLSFTTVAYTRIAIRLWKRNKNGMIYSAVAKHKTKSVRLLLVAVLGFVICWGPSILTNLLQKYRVLDGLSFERKVKLIIWSRFLAPASSSWINTAVYTYFSPEFRKNCVKFGCCCCCCSACRVTAHDLRVSPEARNNGAAIFLSRGCDPFGQHLRRGGITTRM
ncbi:QRFP-like peptide receptor [Oculina patagonica]